jgi:fatty-acyl-CoA synthase
MSELGFVVQHVYGITEAHGIFASCAWHGEWDTLTPEEQARQMARQGVPLVVQKDLMVADSDTFEEVPRDGVTVGEVFTRGNLGMKGYLKDPAATAEAFAGGWYHSGDLAVMHPDGYLEIKDRLKDFIISGGENISSIEVEEAIYTHPGVACAAVVALKDDTWGEVPLAFVELKPEWQGKITAEEMIAHCRERLAHFKCPRRVLFSPVPRTATGKIPKFELRDRAAAQCSQG